MGRTKIALSEVYEELKERAKEVGLNINVEKKKNGRKQENREKKK
jgi:predicted amino acid-binding ACT domain protein